MKRHILHTAAVISFAILVLSGFTFGQMTRNTQRAHDPGSLNCLDCHTCEVPTLREPCLKPCPSFAMTHTTSKHALSEAPDTIMIAEITEQFQPVRFNHKLHAEMAEMGQDCATCHHYSPPGHIPPCKECHGGEANPANLRQPTLKGAYHRQCLSCHREWSHDTKCVLCHTPTEAGGIAAMGYDSTDIIGISHPVITEPTTKVYLTPYESGPVVTFHHSEHIHLFDLSCVDCHQQENCSYCHDLQRPARLAKTQEEVHAICNDCHIDDACIKCHDTKERPGFTHEKTGWELSRYHARLDCRACHPTGKRISKLNSNCVGCHGGWNQDNFAHAVTGLQLDEIHGTMDCSDCHLDLKFTQTPDCTSCHDDGRTPDDILPGEEIRTD
ncbi:hypothetical protein KQH82_10635 [bacterium]|nr:hypothetical protein [bacterium]